MKRTGKLETSKVLLIFCDVLTSIISVAILFALYRGMDLSGTEPLVGGAYGLTSVAHGFYYNKAKLENSIKLRRNNPEDYDAVEKGGEL